MDEPIHTPRPPGPVPLFRPNHVSKDPIPSSSPAFGTPAYPIASKTLKLAQPFAAPIAQQTTSTVLPILLPPQTLRPLAFRTLTKKHNLTLTSFALQCLATFIGKHCGSGWREEGLAERVLDEVGKSWKRANGGVIVEDDPEKKLTNILKFLEPCMSGGRLDIGRLARSNSTNNLSRQNSLSLSNSGGPSREDSQTSLGLSALDVDNNDDPVQPSDPDIPESASARTFLKIISAQSQPRLSYSMTTKSLEVITTPASLFPPVARKTAMFRNRYNLVHQRLLRNELFQTPSFSTTIGRNGSTTLHRSASNAATAQQAYKLTPIANLLGRSGSEHLLLAMLVNSPTGDLALTDLTGSVYLDLSEARPEREDGAWYCPGMIVLVVGVYDEDGGANSSTGGGVGGIIGGRFLASSIAEPPAEKRDVTLGLGNGKSDHVHTSVGAGFGWVDFLGVGSEKALGTQLRRTQRRVLGRNSDAHHTLGEVDSIPRTKIAVLGECTLDNPRTLEAIHGVLASYNASGDVQDIPLSIVLMGNFASAAAMARATAAGGGSIEYKEQFDGLAAVLAEFPVILSSTTLVFVPGDNDPWASSFSGGAAAAIPREGIPELFSSRVRRAVATANQERGRKEGEAAGEVVWASNPARMSLFGPVEEIVLFRDDITGRLRRSAVTFSNAENGDGEQIDIDMDGDVQAKANGHQEEEPMEIDAAIQEASSRIPPKPGSKSTGALDTNTHTARKLVKTILDQGYLSPFPLATRPVFWDYASSLSLYPLPTALVLADAEAPAFAVKYEGCLVMNPGRVVDELGARRGIAKWVEYDVRTRRGVLREHRF
jgi:DNA polymerase epsilon subunit 2